MDMELINQSERALAWENNTQTIPTRAVKKAINVYRFRAFKCRTKEEELEVAESVFGKEMLDKL